MKEGRYHFAQLLKNWNRAARTGAKINTKSGYEALKNDARDAHGATGNRSMEMRGFDTKTGNPVDLSF